MMIQNVKKILAPVDFSSHSMTAMKSAWELAKECGAELHILHVVQPHHTYLPLPLTIDAERAREIAREAAMVEQAEEEMMRIRKDEMENSDKVTIAAISSRWHACMLLTHFCHACSTARCALPKACSRLFWISIRGLPIKSCI
jgi:nucleotide-binding universal stress UspA family protein